VPSLCFEPPPNEHVSDGQPHSFFLYFPIDGKTTKPRTYTKDYGYMTMAFDIPAGREAATDRSIKRPTDILCDGTPHSQIDRSLKNI